MENVIKKIKFWSSMEKNRPKLTDIWTTKKQSSQLLSSCELYLGNYPVLLSVFKRLIGGFENCFDDDYTQYEPLMASCRADFNSVAFFIEINKTKVMLESYLSALKQMSFISNEELLIEFYFLASDILTQYAELDTVDLPESVLYNKVVDLFVTVSDISELNMNDFEYIPEFISKMQSRVEHILNVVQSFIPVCMSCSSLIEKFKTRTESSLKDLHDLMIEFEAESATFFRLKSMDLPRFGLKIIEYLDVPFGQSFWELKVEVSFMSRSSKDNLIKLLNQADCFGSKKNRILNVLQVCSELEKSFQDNMKELRNLSVGIMQSSFFTGDESLDALREFADTWTPSMLSLKSAFNSLIAEEQNLKDVCIPQISYAKVDIDTIDRFMDNLNILSSLLYGETGEVMEPIVNISDLSSKCEILKSLATENFEPTTKLLSRIKRYLDAANNWNSKFGNLMPIKGTRKKSTVQFKQPTLADVELALSDPIVKVVKIPLVDTLQRSLRSSLEFKHELYDLLLPSENGNMARLIEEFDGDNEDEDYDDSLFIRNCYIYIMKIQENIGLVNIDFKEQFDILSWVIELVRWLECVPNCLVSLKLQRLKLSTAKMRLDESAVFDGEIQINIRSALLEMGVLETNESGKLVYSSKSNKIFGKVHKRINLLRSEIYRTEDWERTFEAIELLQQETPMTPEDKIAVEEKRTTLIIQPDRYASEVGEEKSKKRQAKQEPSSKKVKSAENSVKDRKKSDVIKKKIDELHTSVVEIPLKNQRFCAAKGCIFDMVENSSFCNDACAIASSADLLRELLVVRGLMNKKLYTKAESSVPQTDVEMFSLKPFAADESISKLREVFSRNGEIFDSNQAGTSQTSQIKLSLLHPILNTYGPGASLMISRGVLESQATTNLPTILDMRGKIANSIEDVLVASLGRLEHADPFVVGSLLASEMEEELYNKYSRFDLNSSKKNDYRTHFTQLKNNLKKRHNDVLVCSYKRFNGQ